MIPRTYDVRGMTCGHCQAAIESEVGALAGVSSVAVDLEAARVTVDGAASDQAIRDAIAEAGYEVVGSGPAGVPGPSGAAPGGDPLPG